MIEWIWWSNNADKILMLTFGLHQYMNKITPQTIKTHTIHRNKKNFQVLALISFFSCKGFETATDPEEVKKWFPGAPRLGAKKLG